MEKYPTHKVKGTFLPPGKRPWKHELEITDILASSGYYVEYLVEGRIKMADIRINGTTFELKCPEKFNANTLLHTLRRGAKQSRNMIIGGNRMNKVDENKTMNFLKNYRKNPESKFIKRLIFISSNGKIIDIDKC